MIGSKGAGSIEWGLIAALIAISVIAAIKGMSQPEKRCIQWETVERVSTLSTEQ
jgi:hypothetical protein